MRGFTKLKKKHLLKISAVYLIGNPEICQDPPSCGQDDQTLSIYLFFSAQGRSTWSDDISSLSRIGILIGKAEYYFQDLPSDSKATGYGRIEEMGLTADFAAYDAIFRQS